MQLHLDSYGAFLGVRDGMFHIRLKHAADQFLPVRELRGIHIGPGVSVSSNALRLAIEHDIPVILLDRLDRPVGQVWSGRYGSIATIRKQQALWTTDVQGMGWVRTVLRRKIRNRLAWLEPLAAAHPPLGPSLAGLAAVAAQFQQWRYQGEDHATLGATFRGWEGAAGKHYFAALAALLPARFDFRGRSHRPAFDPFNALLNYLYAFLYSRVELALMKAGLDPYNGVLHADQYKRPTLVYDAIEQYRYWAEQVAFQLCGSGRLTPDDFARPSPEEGFLLRSTGKPTVIAAMLDFLEEQVDQRDRRYRRGTLIDLDAQQLAREIKAFTPIHRIL